MKKNLLPLLLTLCLLLCLLAGCGAKSSSSEDIASQETASTDYAAEEAPAEADTAEAYDDGYIDASNDAANSGSASESTLADKIIYSGYLNIESTDFDAACSAISRMVSECGGFIESSDVNGYTDYRPDGTTQLINRYATYVLRVPSSSFQDFLSDSRGLGNVTSSRTNAENITPQYTDTEARKQSLEVQEERILAMMEQTDDIESLIELESRLSEIRYEMDSLSRTLIDWQNQVDYSTVTLELSEVESYTPVTEEPLSFSQRMADAFGAGWRGLRQTVSSLLIGLAAAWPVLLILILAAILTIVLVRRSHKRAVARAAARYAAMQQNQQVQNPPQQNQKP